MKTIRGDFLSNCLALILLCAPAPPVQAAGRLISWGSDANGQIRGTPSGSDFIAVSEGLSFSLALRSDGTIAAWGDDTYGAVRNAPRGDGFIQIEAGDNHAVALRADGSIVAWGLDNYGQVSTRPDGTGFVKVAAGGVHCVALRADGTVVAWGDGGYGQLEVPFGTFRDVDANSLGNTAVRSDGTLAFWGYYGHGQYNWPTGDGFVKAFGGAVMSMAMRADGSLVAWGGNNFLQVSGTPAGPGFQSFAEGYGACMALRADGSIVAWGMEQYGSGNAGLIAGVPAGRGFTTMAVGYAHATAILDRAPTPMGRLVSWGSDATGQLSGTPAGNDFVAVSVGAYFSLALRVDGTIAAWGDDTYGTVRNAPTGDGFVQIEAGDNHAVALRSDGSIVAWGLDNYGQVSRTPFGTRFTKVSAGAVHSVALSADGALRAWGDNGYGQLGVPEGTFLDVDANSLGGSAVRADGTLVYWGYRGQGLNNSPAGGGFEKIFGGAVTSVAQRPDGSLVAWGDDAYGQVSGTPTGPGFRAYAEGYGASLALRADGSIAAWGREQYGTTNIGLVAGAPAGTGFIAVAVGYNQAVAIVPSAVEGLVAYPQTVTGNEDTDVVITLRGNDPTPADGFTALIVTLPNNGTLYQCNYGFRGAPITTLSLVVTDPQHRVVYVPALQGNGKAFDGFDFSVLDGDQESAAARVTINIAAVNDAPIAGFGTSLAVPGNSSAELTRAPFASPTSDFTIEAWVRSQALNDGSFHGILGRQGAGGTANRSPSLWQGPDRGALHLDSYSTAGRRFGLQLPGFFEATGVWVHLALVKQGTTYRVYRNGRLFGSGPAPAAVRILPDGFSFGRVDKYFRGHLDDIRIWQTARTETDVRADAYRYLTGREPGLRGAWSCNEADGKLLRDLSPFRNHARLTGNAGFSTQTPPLVWESAANTVLNGWLPAGDFEGDTLNFYALTTPRFGTLRLRSNGSFTYTPRAGYAGPDNFSYYVTDGRSYSSIPTVTFRLTPPAPARTLLAR
ncbi:hypothetical protein LBMAG56_39080 [Verrucomicrobiota bacterium]|nr:hypothetical protein LBMAG56_39080 [Verrucomicrobiota bacterium]